MNDSSRSYMNPELQSSYSYFKNSLKWVFNKTKDNLSTHINYAWQKAYDLDAYLHNKSLHIDHGDALFAHPDYNKTFE